MGTKETTFLFSQLHTNKYNFYTVTNVVKETTQRHECPGSSQIYFVWNSENDFKSSRYCTILNVQIKLHFQVKLKMVPLITL